jgi:hypothetical protein
MRATYPAHIIVLGLITLISFASRWAIKLKLNWILCSVWKEWISAAPPPYSPDLASCDFWAFPTVKMELRGKKFRGDERSAARFREVGEVL